MTSEINIDHRDLEMAQGKFNDPVEDAEYLDWLERQHEDEQAQLAEELYWERRAAEEEEKMVMEEGVF